MLGHIAWEGDLKQDVVEEEGAEDAAQLLPLLDVPQAKSLAEVVPARLLQPLHVKTSLQLGPECHHFSSTLGGADVLVQQL